MKRVTDGAVLFADDQENDRKLFLLAAGDANWAHRIIQFEDGELLIDYLNHSKQSLPALIILDLKMRNVGGLEVLACLRTNRKFDMVPAVMLSNSDEEKDVRQAMALGATGYRTKPTDYADLVRLAQDLWNRWLDPRTGGHWPKCQIQSRQSGSQSNRRERER